MACAGLLLTAVWLTCLSIQPAWAGMRNASPPAQEQQVASCIERAAAGRPWLARTLWGLRDQEGGWIGAAVRNSNGSEDLGPLQVNSWWSSRIAAVIRRKPVDVRYWLQYDACFNVDAARWIFLSALAVTRDYWKAIGAYHSPTGWRQRRYVGGVVDRLRHRFGQDIFHPAAPVCGIRPCASGRR